MNTKSKFSILGLAHKVFLAAERAGYSPALFDELLKKPELFDQFLQLQRGMAELKPRTWVVNLDADPLIPEGYEDDLTVESHQKGGKFTWDSDRLRTEDIDTHGVNGEDLVVAYQGKPVFNACLLDFLLKHPGLIPDYWKQPEDAMQMRPIYFLGTIYKRRSLFPDMPSRLCVRCLEHGGYQWTSSVKNLNDQFGANGVGQFRTSLRESVLVLAN
jgi:hypothetical protein